MISQKDIKELEFKSINEYYEYILSSAINGQFRQARELITKLSKNQFIDFMSYMGNFDSSKEHYSWFFDVWRNST